MTIYVNVDSPNLGFRYFNCIVIAFFAKNFSQMIKTDFVLQRYVYIFGKINTRQY